MLIDFNATIKRIKEAFLVAQKRISQFGRSFVKGFTKEIKGILYEIKTIIRGEASFLILGKKVSCKEGNLDLGEFLITVAPEFADEYEHIRTSPQRKMEIVKSGLIIGIRIDLNNLFLMPNERRFDYVESKFRKLINESVKDRVFGSVYGAAPNAAQRKEADSFLKDFSNHLKNSSFDLEERSKQKQENNGTSSNDLVFCIDLSKKEKNKEAFFVFPKIESKKDCVKSCVELRPVEKKEGDLSQQQKDIPNSSFVSCDATSLSPKQSRCVA